MYVYQRLIITKQTQNYITVNGHNFTFTFGYENFLIQ